MGISLRVGLRYAMVPEQGRSGDLIFSGLTPDGRQWVLVGDLAGHGPLVASKVPLLAERFEYQVQQGGDGCDLIRDLDIFLGELSDSELSNHYLVYCLAELSPDRQSLRLWNGGLPGCFLSRSDGTLQHFPSQGIPLGTSIDISPELEYMDEEFHPGDCLYLFTDGLSEAVDVQGQYIGAEAIVQLLSELEEYEELDTVLTRIVSYCQRTEASDDMTLVELRNWATS